MIETNGERESGKSVQAARHDDDYSIKEYDSMVYTYQYNLALKYWDYVIIRDF